MENEWVLLGERDARRRYRYVRIAPQLLADILGGGYRAIEAEVVVPDLRIVAVRASSWRAELDLLVMSETFEAVPESQLEPEWAPSYTRRTITANELTAYELGFEHARRSARAEGERAEPPLQAGRR